MVRAFPRGVAEKRQHFMERLEAVRACLEAGAEAAEELATLPQATVDLLYEEGLLHLKLPEVLGGAELDPLAYLDVIEALSRIESAAGWCALINCTSIAWPGAFLPDEAIGQIFAGGRVPIAAGAAGPLGRAKAVEGGYLVDGRWPFGSGIRHAEWAVAGCRIEGDRQDRRGISWWPFRWSRCGFTTTGRLWASRGRAVATIPCRKCSCPASSPGIWKNLGPNGAARIS